MYVRKLNGRSDLNAPENFKTFEIVENKMHQPNVSQGNGVCKFKITDVSGLVSSTSQLIYCMRETDIQYCILWI